MPTTPEIVYLAEDFQAALDQFAQIEATWSGENFGLRSSRLIACVEVNRGG
jgi:hypothetical protein